MIDDGLETFMAEHAPGIVADVDAMGDPGIVLGHCDRCGAATTVGEPLEAHRRWHRQITLTLNYVATTLGGQGADLEQVKEGFRELVAALADSIDEATT